MTDVGFPVAILDFEASGLSRFSFPVEVGFARWRGLEAPIESWSTLIRPDLDWIHDGHWSEDAEAMHGIALDDLGAGMPAKRVCERLNAELAGCTVCCDGLLFDQVWWMQLYEAGNLRASYHLESMIGLYHLANPGLVKWLGENADVPHRARQDAERLMRAFAYGMKRRPPRVVQP